MKLATRLSLAMGLVVLMTGTVNIYLNYRALEDHAAPVEIERVRVDLAGFASRLETELRYARAELLAQRWSSPVLQLTREFDSASNVDLTAVDGGWRRNLESNFRAILRSQPEVLQFRLIGVADGGRELVRVERDVESGEVYTVPVDRLQTKAHRDYFIETVKRPDNDVYVSPINLNRELERIQIPPVPVLRLATPIHDAGGQVLAIMVINIHLHSWFNDLRGHAGKEERGFVVNANGDYLLHPDPDAEFAFEFGRSRRFGMDHPELGSWLGSDSAETRIWRDGKDDTWGVAMVPMVVPGGGWIGLVKIVPYSQLISSITPLLHSSFYAVLISFTMAILLASFVSSELTAALGRLLEAVGRYRGDGAIRLESSHNVREIEALGEAFENMSRDLADNIAHRNRLTEQFKRVVEHSPSGSLMVGENGQITLANPQGALMFGYPRERMVGMTVEELVPQRFRDNHEGLRKGFLWERGPRRMGAGRDLYALRADGTEFPIEVTLTPIDTLEGAMILTTVIDITERKLSEQALRESLAEKEVLLKEVYHRVKNNLEIISSLLSLQEMQVPDGEAREALRDSSARVKSMSLVHNMLYRSEQYQWIDIRPYIDSLVREFRSSHGRIARSIEVETKIVEVRLSIGTTIPLGLLINELMSNAFRHAFADEGPGKLRIELAREGGDFVLSVSDNGRGLPEDFDLEKSASLGFTLVRSLSQQLYGKASVERDGGTRVIVRFRGD